MENKNFEKTTEADFKHISSYPAIRESYAKIHNTCLDRTNAKGLRNVLEECYLFLFDNRLNPELTNKILAELKKAEDQ